MASTLPLLYTHVMGSHGFPVLVLDRARQDQGRRVRADRRAGDLRRRHPARDPRPGARRHRRDLRRRDAPLLLRADLLRPHGRPRDARAAAQDRPLRLRQRAALPRHPEGHGAEGPRHGRRVQVPGEPDRPAGEGHLPGTGDALDPHPDPARRRLRRRPPRALLGPGARGERGAPGPRRGRRHLDPGRRAVRRDRARPGRRVREDVQRLRGGRPGQDRLPRLLRQSAVAPARQAVVSLDVSRAARDPLRPVRVRVRQPGDGRDRDVEGDRRRPRHRLRGG